MHDDTVVLPAARPPQNIPLPTRPRRRPDVYQVLAAVLVLWSIGVAVQHTWTIDFLLHVATVQALARDLLTPPDPMTGTGSGSPYYSPLTWLLAAAVRVTGLSPTALFGGLAVANMVLLLVAFRRFCGWFTTSPAGAALALVATLFLWGLRPVVWSGFLSMRSLAEVLPYPSTTAFGLMLLALDRLLRYRRDRDTVSLLWFGLLGAVITVLHSFTALNTAIGALAVLLSPGPRWRPADLLRVTGVGAGAFGLVAAWPFATVGDLFAGAPDFVTIHRQLGEGMLDPVQLSCAYGLFGLVPLVLRARRQARDPLVLIFGLAAVVVAAGFAAGQYHLLRSMPMAMLALHVAFGAFVAGAVAPVDGARPKRPASDQPGGAAEPPAPPEQVAAAPAARRGRRLLGALAVLTLLAGLAVDITPLNGFIGAVPTRLLPASLEAQTRTPSLSGPSHRYDFVRDHVPAGATVLSDRRSVDRHLNWLGYYTVNPGWPNPWIGDQEARAAARRSLLSGGTSPADRGAIASAYGADCVLITGGKVAGPDAVGGYRQVRDGRGGSLYCR
ncbi:hypothetical protein [Micromonospora deserti]|uniref:Glycosyltransferase RgtA/B/C/D-like domain-containing protein n=1 Tax=Micromonospora deserti TaxID=2070366 RepID=A0A2W2CL49_9ACTN|nr:hypothetical protein [Micromonospora deserti]PZG00166.1 hypothetical protein C1I99_10165 [Micromonospora deserti]